VDSLNKSFNAESEKKKELQGTSQDCKADDLVVFNPGTSMKG
jgi:hypothetical protein